MECREVQGFLHAYLDGEFDEEERVAILAHLQRCERCSELVSFERTLREKVRYSLSDDTPVPETLKSRVHKALREVEEPENESWAIRGLRWLIPAAAAAMLLVGAVISQRQQLRPANVLAESTIEWHRRNNIPLDVKASSPEAVKGFFSDKVPFAVRPPVFNRPRVQLVGGRLANLQEHAAAYLVYRVDGRRVSVFIFDSTALPTMREPRRQRVRWHRLRGYNVAVYSSGGTGYAVASDMAPEQMVRLIAY